MSSKSIPSKDPTRWEKRYIEGDLPWDSGERDRHLEAVIQGRGIQPGKTLEIGCGTGTNAIWLAKQGADVTATDLSPTAIARAEAKAADAGVRCRFLVSDFLVDPIPDGPFEFAFDRGCLHSFDDADDRDRFVSRVAEQLTPDGVWVSLIGSTDGPPRESGPPRRSARDVVHAVEPHFEILELRSVLFDPVRLPSVSAWVLVARRRSWFPPQNSRKRPF